MDSNLSIATIRSLCIDMINKANSGHPGMVLDGAPALYTLFTKVMNINPSLSSWQNRDRFVLASGHASSLLYALLHLSGYDLSLDDLKQFRQWQSKTPGHPEITITDGVDASSGPLGQGVPTATGMAIAEKFLAEKYNKEDCSIVDHYTYVLCGDGDMQEGVTYEASSLAGHLSLGKLIVIYDANEVTLDGPLSYSFSENVKKRYEAMNWQVIEVADGNDIQAINRALKRAKKELFKPSIIIMKTVIGYGSCNQGTNKVHGSPLGEEDGKNAKLSYGFDHDPFYVPEEVYADFKENTVDRGRQAYDTWVALVDEYKQSYPELGSELARILEGKDAVEFQSSDFPAVENGYSQATRNSSQDALNAIADKVPTFLGGSADLAHSNMTYIKSEGLQDDEHRLNRNIQFGVREFAMGAILNGMSLHGGLRVYGGTFFVFSDYVKAAVRLSALQGLPVTYVFTHDSIAVGEDGPTHEPIEHLAGLRAIPNLNVYRPADARETQAAWYQAVTSKSTPTALVLTRQNLTVEEGTDFDKVSRGAYVVHETAADFDTILLASGSEVNLAVASAKALESEGYKVRVVSVPSTDVFDAQDQAYKEEVLPNAVRRRVAIEMAASLPWYKYVGLDGAVIGIDTFGASAPAAKIIEEYGFTVENIVEKVKGMN